jgi:hypothetical protein
MDIVDDLRKDPDEEERQYKREARIVLGGVLNDAANEIKQLRNDNNRLAWLAIDNAKDTGRALMYRKILQQIADEASGHDQALAYVALKEKE